MSAHEALLVVTASHLAFQVTVSVVVYPALSQVPAARWTLEHEAHSRRITVVVAVLYPSLVGVLGWAVVTLPVSVGLVAAVAGTVLALAVTALVAAPAHGRLGRERTERAMRRLLVADRVRTVGAAVALLGAVPA